MVLVEKIQLPVSPIIATEQKQIITELFRSKFYNKNRAKTERFHQKNRAKAHFSLSTVQSQPKSLKTSGCYNHPKNRPLDPLSELFVKILNPLDDMRIRLLQILIPGF